VSGAVEHDQASGLSCGRFAVARRQAPHDHEPVREDRQRGRQANSARARPGERGGIDPGEQRQAAAVGHLHDRRAGSLQVSELL
jgi:hypothetical protein